MPVSALSPCSPATKSSFLKKSRPYAATGSVILISYAIFSYFHYITVRNRQENFSQYVKNPNSISPDELDLPIEVWERFFPATYLSQSNNYESKCLRLNLFLQVKLPERVYCESTEKTDFQASIDEFLKAFLDNPDRAEFISKLENSFKILKIALISGLFSLKNVFSDSSFQNDIKFLDLYYEWKHRELDRNKDQVFFKDLQSFLKRFSPNTTSFSMLLIQVQATSLFSYYELKNPSCKLDEKPENTDLHTLHTGSDCSEDPKNTLSPFVLHRLSNDGDLDDSDNDDFYSIYGALCYPQHTDSHVQSPPATPPATPQRPVSIPEKPRKTPQTYIQEPVSTTKTMIAWEEMPQFVALYDGFYKYFTSLGKIDIDSQSDNLQINLAARKVFEEFKFEKIFPRSYFVTLKDLFSTEESQKKILFFLRKLCTSSSKENKDLFLDFILTLQGACPLMVCTKDKSLPLAAILHNIEDPLVALDFFLPAFQMGTYDLYSSSSPVEFFIKKGEHKNGGDHFCKEEAINSFLEESTKDSLLGGF